MKYIVTLNGKNYEVEVTESEAVLTKVSDVQTVSQKNTPSLSEPQKAEQKSTVVSGTNIVAPMPGTVLSVNVSIGQKVKRGDVLIVLEAMKMENDIVAPSDGVIKQILVSKGSTVNTDDILAVI